MQQDWCNLMPGGLQRVWRIHKHLKVPDTVPPYMIALSLTLLHMRVTLIL